MPIIYLSYIYLLSIYLFICHLSIICLCHVPTVYLFIICHLSFVYICQLDIYHLSVYLSCTHLCIHHLLPSIPSLAFLLS